MTTRIPLQRRVVVGALRLSNPIDPRIPIQASGRVTASRTVLTALALLVMASPSLAAQQTKSGASAPPLTGRWEGTLHYDSLTGSFPLTWSGADALRPSALAFYNGADSITSTAVRVVHTERGALQRGGGAGVVVGDSVIVEFAHLAARLRGTRTVDGFEGWFGNLRRRDSVRVTARPRVVAPAVAEGAVPTIAGTWVFPVESSKGERAWRFVAQQSGAEVTATILRVDGDAGAHTGSFADGRFSLSHFDGTRPGRLDVEPNADGSLTIVQRSTRGSARRYVAWREADARARGIAEPADVATHTSVRDPREPFVFDFPDVTGARVTNRDARYVGKVVVVNVTGTWCPNCHDEAPFLSALYGRYRDRGLEVVALDFEEAEELADLSRLRAFVKRYGVEYAYLVAGEPREVAARLPQAVNLNTWPATFFLGRDGTVRAVRTGFAAKASGVHHDTLVAEYQAIVEALLEEPAAVVKAR